MNGSRSRCRVTLNTRWHSSSSNQVLSQITRWRCHTISYATRNCTVYSHFIVEFNCTNVFNAHCTLHVPRDSLRKIVNHQHYCVMHFFIKIFYLSVKTHHIFLNSDVLRLCCIEFCLKTILHQAAFGRSEKYLKSSVPFSFYRRKEKLFTPVFPSFAPQSICFSSDNFFSPFSRRHLVGKSLNRLSLSKKGRALANLYSRKSCAK